jgi:hypothetical protein
MANENWYALKVRAGFEPAAQRLRELALDTLIPDQKSIDPQDSQAQQSRFTGSVCCRIRLVDRGVVAVVSGGADILGAPQPISINEDMASLQTTTRFSPGNRYRTAPQRHR